MAGYSSYEMQRSYDTVYMQCMYAHGNQVPVRMSYRGSVPPPSGMYPPPNTPPPYPPVGTPPPSLPPEVVASVIVL